jgi:AcrR family transcriptional regulator
MSIKKGVQMAKRISRTESQILTRSKLLAAAEVEFSRLGFEGAAVDKITEKAGYSRGAFYANFKSKEELFLTLVEDRMNTILIELAQLSMGEKTLKKDAVLKYYLSRAYDKKLALLMSEFLVAGIRNTKLRSKIANLNHSYLDEVGKVISLISSNKKEARQIAALLLASGQGLMLYHFCDPENYSEKLIEEMMVLNFEKLLK